MRNSSLEKCQRDREFDKCFKEKKDAKEKHKDMHSKDKERKASLDQGRDKREKAFLESSPRTSSEKKTKKGSKREELVYCRYLHR